HPHIVLMDIQMPGMSGVEATAQICALQSQPRVVILTTFDYDSYVFDGIKAGASGYLLKDTPVEELLAAIQRVHAGESIIYPSIAARMISEFSRRRSYEPQYEALSERELA